MIWTNLFGRCNFSSALINVVNFIVESMGKIKSITENAFNAIVRASNKPSKLIVKKKNDTNGVLPTESGKIIRTAKMNNAIHFRRLNIKKKGSFEITTKPIDIINPIKSILRSFNSTIEIIRMKIQTNFALGSKLCNGDFISAYLSISKWLMSFLRPFCFIIFRLGITRIILLLLCAPG